ncbi:hypothetical protein GGX14DRAFT_568380 [Mycena pura]|uniref:Uncharacterized protein n=1 Tax=Mycena pura TaxID=153505 RepID=A0AAD6YCZ5_9AGAR|nr:hypothetical protein GGX14DRAFT_568380 [Mycena pura]
MRSHLRGSLCALLNGLPRRTSNNGIGGDLQDADKLYVELLVRPDDDGYRELYGFVNCFCALLSQASDATAGGGGKFLSALILFKNNISRAPIKFITLPIPVHCTACCPPPAGPPPLPAYATRWLRLPSTPPAHRPPSALCPLPAARPPPTATLPAGCACCQHRLPAACPLPAHRRHRPPPRCPHLGRAGCPCRPHAVHSLCPPAAPAAGPNTV